MTVYSIYKSFQIQAWLNWLEEKWVCDEQRKWVLQSFVHHGLVPLLASKGYVLGCSVNKLVATIARELFIIRNGRRSKKSWHSSVLNTEYGEEEFSHYNYIMDEDTWDEFWEGWTYLFDENCVKERFIVQHAVWTCLDLDRSPQTAILYESYETDEEQVFRPRANGNDPYLMDMAEGYQDKY
jgi:hypothetical protein